MSIAGCGVKFRASYSASGNTHSNHCACKFKMMLDNRKFDQCFVCKIAKSLSQSPSFLLSDSSIVSTFGEA